VLLGFEDQVPTFSLDGEGVQNFGEGNSLRKTYIDNRSDDLGYGSLLRHVRMGDLAN